MTDEEMDDVVKDVDPEAPWGRKADGSPRAKPGVKPGGPKKRTAGPPPKKKAPPKPKGPDYRGAILGLLQLPAGVLAMAGTQRPELLADASAILLYAEPIADSVHALAVGDPRVAAVLERLLSVGPYGALIAAVSPLILQILCNHGVIAPGLLGTMLPAQVVAHAAGHAGPIPEQAQAA